MASDYITSAELKIFLDISDTDDDERLIQAAGWASRTIDRLCRRPDGDFAAQTATRYFDTDGGTQVHFPSPLLSVTTLKSDDDGDGTFETTWTANTDYWLYPLNETPKWRMVVNPLGNYVLFAGNRRLQIVGSWGEATTPPEPIRAATAIYAARYFNRHKTPEGVAGSAEQGFITLREVDPDVANILRNAGYMTSRALI